MDKRLIFPAIAAAAAGFLYFDNNALRSVTYECSFENLPEAFDGYRIVHLSDLHGKIFGDRQKRLIRRIISLKPDIVVSTGDMVSVNGKGLNSAALIASSLTENGIPMLYISGNHEAWLNGYGAVKEVLTSRGCTVLDNRIYIAERGNDRITFIGIGDQRLFRTKYTDGTEGFSLKLKQLCDYSEGFRILLSHRPHFAEFYSSLGVDLVFCGHAHGGQIRLPFVGGLYAPEQGFLPKYDSGKHEIGGMTEIISRGLGNSSFPIRFLNRPEVSVTVLKKE